jgi:hypothetical protein
MYRVDITADLNDEDHTDWKRKSSSPRYRHIGEPEGGEPLRQPVRVNRHELVSVVGTPGSLVVVASQNDQPSIF